ncbi:MAG: hypothetical protein ACRYGR_10325 [Janthinobacterium lividum]
MPAGYLVGSLRWGLFFHHQLFVLLVHLSEVADYYSQPTYHYWLAVDCHWRHHQKKKIENVLKVFQPLQPLY